MNSKGETSATALRLGLTACAFAGRLASSFPRLCKAKRTQPAKPNANEGRVFQANARIVVLDVVVTGKNRRPLTGLHKQDFVLTEDGHPQTITYFEEHTSEHNLCRQAINLPDLPPNVFTNIPRVNSTDSVMVLSSTP